MKPDVPLNADERLRAGRLTVWIVWYEDRFGWGPDRDPAAPLAAFLSEAEAERSVEEQGGEPDVVRGKFDGYFHSRSNLLSAADRGIVTPARARELLREAE